MFIRFSWLKQNTLVYFFILHVLLSFSANAQIKQNILVDELNPRSIGPAGMGGRITDIQVSPIDETIIYIATASGGIWKSEGGGVKWKPIFDKQSTSSIGALAIDPNNTSVIWAGTGEGNPRNSQNSGDGIYKSEDGGETWKLVGLEGSKNIHRIIIDPVDGNTVYVGVQGTAWGESTERGVYKTTDGGITWDNILYVNENTGIGDLVMDPKNPSKLIAGMWQFRRWPWFFKSGGEGSGMYISYDAGKTWEKKEIKDGMPEGELGRIGLAIAPSDPEIIYALIESEKTALYRSENGGDTWNKVTDRNVGARPFYYADIFVDPLDKNRLYNLWTMVSVSSDGGRSFRPFLAGEKSHGDHHAFWINPNNPNHIIDGNDGGLVITHDKGASWRYIRNIPLGQFYHVNVDNDFPYQVYGGMQDNGLWSGPGYVLKEGGIRNADWKSIGFGDGFDAFPIENTRYGFSMWQGGNVIRFDKQTGLKTEIRPVHPKGEKLRWNWNAAMAQDPFDKHTLYVGSQFVHVSEDEGNSWQTISPDLTTNNPERQKQMESGGLTIDATRAENYTTLTAIAPSPLSPEVIWTGSDDGMVYVTRDGGKSWKNVNPSDKICPQDNWVNQIIPSTYKANEAFLVMDNHRMNDFKPYIFFTDNYGRSWHRIADEMDMKGYALTFLQDPEAPDLMFAGTETGLYFSVNGAKDWQEWPKPDFPVVPVSDMALQKGTNDLVVATFGRSVYVIDDISPLRNYVNNHHEVVSKPIHLFKPAPAIQSIYASPDESDVISADMFTGENKDRGVAVSFYANPVKNEPLATIKISRKQGEVIRTFTVIVNEGINRFYWELCRKSVKLPGQFKGYFNSETAGVPVSPGTYYLELFYADERLTTSIEVLPDPRVEDFPDYRRFEELLSRLQVATYSASAILDRLEEARQNLSNVTMRLVGHDDKESVKMKTYTDSVDVKLQHLIDRIKVAEVQGVKRETGVINDKLSHAELYFNSPYINLGENHIIVLEDIERDISSLMNDVNSFFNTDWKEYRKAAVLAKISFINEYRPLIFGASSQNEDE